MIYCFRCKRLTVLNDGRCYACNYDPHSNKELEEAKQKKKDNAKWTQSGPRIGNPRTPRFSYEQDRYNQISIEDLFNLKTSEIIEKYSLNFHTASHKIPALRIKYGMKRAT